MFLVCSDHKGMSKKIFEVNSLLCCASLLVAVLCNTIDTTQYRDTKSRDIYFKIGIVGIDYAI